MASCPEGHALPFKSPSGECTPLYCAVPPITAPPPEAQSLFPTESREDGVDYSEKLEKRQIDKALVREAIRNKALGVPRELPEGTAAEEFVDQQLTKWSSPAAMEVIGRLRFGNDDQRYRAAKDILAATGHGPKEAGGRMGALIILQADGAQVLTAPWRRKKVKEIETVEGTVVSAKEDK